MSVSADIGPASISGNEATLMDAFGNTAPDILIKPVGTGNDTPANTMSDALGVNGAGSPGLNFSVLNLEATMKTFFDKMLGMSSELESVLNFSRQTSDYVKSEDSGLAGAWDSVGNAMNKFSGRLSELCSDMRTNVNKYIEETVRNEISAATNTDAIAKDIDNISNQLDLIFAEK